MQTFLPYPNIYKSVACLDNKRLGKQRCEARQILHVINFRKFYVSKEKNIKIGWEHHPIVKMWYNYEDALKLYYNICLSEWISRGFNNTMSYENICNKIVYPKWFGNREFHRSHQSNLVRKFPEHYRKYFKTVPDDLPYIWFDENGNKL